ncbi:hypothetical protein D3C76_785320 [compost metagenome]
MSSFISFGMGECSGMKPLMCGFRIFSTADLTNSPAFMVFWALIPNSSHKL